MSSLFATIEDGALSTWIRESLSILAFPGILTLHTLALAVLAGAHVAVGLRLLGVGRQMPLRPLAKVFPVAWWAFWVSLATGVALLLAYPTKALTNPLFYVKLTLIALALITASRIRRILIGLSELDRSPPKPARPLAVASLLWWSGAIVAGRLLAYTYTRLLAGT